MLREHAIAVVADRPEVGANLQDHLCHTLKVRVRSEGLLGNDLSTLLRMPGAIRAFAREGRGFLTTNVAESGGFVKSAATVERPDLQLQFCVGIADDHGRKLHFVPGYCLQAFLLRPHSRGSVTLAGPDIRTPPRIDPNYLSDARDLECLLAGTRISRRIMTALAEAGMKGTPLAGPDGDDDEALRAAIRAEADTQYHPVGTCRMGGDPASVVDPQLRVRTIDALRIADASVMPTLISGNTQAPTVIIAEKASDLILGRAAP